MTTPAVALESWLGDLPPREALAESPAGAALSRLLLMQASDVAVLSDVFTAVRDDWSRHGTAWRQLIAAADQALTKEAMVAVFETVLPQLVELLAIHHESLPAEQVHLAFRLIVRYQHLDGMELLLRLARRGEHVDGAAWGPLFATIAQSEALWQFSIHRLARVPPAGDCGVAFLHLCLQLCSGGKIESLPHATDRGCRQLQHWLEDVDHPERGQVALAAVPYLAGEWQSLLLGLAADHPHPEVRLIGNAVAAGLGNEEALGVLVAEALGDHVYQQTAQDALLELTETSKMKPAMRSVVDSALLLVDLQSRGVAVRRWHVLWRDPSNATLQRSLVRVQSADHSLDRVWLLGSGSDWECEFDPAKEISDWHAVIASWPVVNDDSDHSVEDGWHHRADAARLHRIGSAS